MITKKQGEILILIALLLGLVSLIGSLIYTVR